MFECQTRVGFIKEQVLRIKMVKKRLFDESEGKKWKDLLLGLQNKLGVTQQEVLDEVGLKRTSEVSFWISGKCLPSKKTRFKFIGFIKKNKFDIEDLIKFGKKVRTSIKFNDNWVSIDKSAEHNHFNKNLILNICGQKYLNTPMLFPKIRNEEPLKFILKARKIIVFYRGKYHHSLEPYLISKYLKIDKVLLVGLGIYLAEGARNRKPKITNSEPMIINQAIRLFELLGVRKGRLKAWIQLHERSTKSFNVVRKFWLKNSNLSEKNITSIRIKKSTGNGKVKEYGTIHLESSFVLSQLLIKKLLILVPDILRQLPQEQIIYFLQGAFAGEGSVNIAKSGSVNMIRYTSTNKIERDMIKKLLEKLGFKVYENEKKYDLTITGFFDIGKALDLNLFKYHPLRRERLVNGFHKLKQSHVPRLNKNKILNLLHIKRVLTTTQIQKQFNLSQQGVSKHLVGLYKNGEIRMVKGSGSIPHKWFLV